MATRCSWKTGNVCWKWRPYKARRLLSDPIYAKNDGNGPPSADQDLSTAEPRNGHAVCTLRVLSSTSACPALSAVAEPKSQGHCRKSHDEAESIMTTLGAIGTKGQYMSLTNSVWWCQWVYSISIGHSVITKVLSIFHCYVLTWGVVSALTWGVVSALTWAKWFLPLQWSASGHQNLVALVYFVNGCVQVLNLWVQLAYLYTYREFAG